MPLLGPHDRLTRRPSRVLVAGTSGAGKTTVATKVAGLLGLPRVELDSLFHGPGWRQRASFATDVDAFSREATWVTEWQYTSVRALLAERADLLVWLDLPRPQVMRQLVRRTVVRRLRRDELWNGNLEPPLWTVFTDPDHIVRWGWRTHAATAERVADLHRGRPELVVVRLRTRAEVERWLDGPLTDVALTDAAGG